MSKQSEAKQAQNYRKHPNTCSNCTHFQSECIKHIGEHRDWQEEKNLRCSVGGFAVKKTSTCRIHVLKEGGAM